MLGGELAVLQASIFDGLALDPITLLHDRLCRAELGVSRRDLVLAFVIC